MFAKSIEDCIVVGFELLKLFGMCGVSFSNERFEAGQ